MKRLTILIIALALMVGGGMIWNATSVRAEEAVCWCLGRCTPQGNFCDILCGDPPGCCVCDACVT